MKLHGRLKSALLHSLVVVSGSTAWLMTARAEDEKESTGETSAFEKRTVAGSNFDRLPVTPQTDGRISPTKDGFFKPGVPPLYQPSSGIVLSYQPKEVFETDEDGKVTARTIYEESYVPWIKSEYASANPGLSKASQLAIQYLNSNDITQRESLKADLKRQLETEFDQMHATQATQIETMRQRLENAEAMHRERLENKDKIVERRMGELLGTPDNLRWIPQSVTTTGTPNPFDPTVYLSNAGRYPSYGISTNQDPQTTDSKKLKTTIHHVPNQLPSPATQYGAPSDLQSERGWTPQLTESGSPPAIVQSRGLVRSYDPMFALLRQIKAREGELELAESQLEQSRPLAQKRLMSKSELENLEMAVKRLRSLKAIDAKQLDYWRLTIGRRVAEANSDLRKDSKENPDSGEAARQELGELKKLQSLISENDALLPNQ